MTYRRSIHFRKNEAGDFQCGGHVRTFARPSDHSDTTTDPWLVDCDRCRRSPAWKAASKAKNERKQKHRDMIVEGGFDPDKPMSEWTTEEVMAYVKWRDSQEGE